MHLSRDCSPFYLVQRGKLLISGGVWLKQEETAEGLVEHPQIQNMR